ncbi:hypothetical protein EDD11_002658 [Mortierella claussenii]|nr:hypothetical protein EDD11_002658 [Mortierella claussenii]
MIPARPSAVVLSCQLRFVTLWLVRRTYTSSNRAGLLCPKINRHSLHHCHQSTPARLFSSTSNPITFATNTVEVSNAASSSLIQSATETTTSAIKGIRKRVRIEWTPEADAQVLEMRAMQNKTWTEIGQALNRKPATCLTRFESTLNPALRDFWTPNRDKQLDMMVAASRGWSEIGLRLGCHRLACMERWRQLGKDELAQMPVEQGQSGDTVPTVRSERNKKTLQRQVVERSADQQQQTLVDAQEQLKDMVGNMKGVQQVDKDYDHLSWNSLLRDEQRYSHYRSWKKETKPVGFSQLYLMNPGWSAKEETVLIQFVLKYGLESWDVVAKEGLKGRFTAAQCRTCWKNLDMPVVSPVDSTEGQCETNPGSSVDEDSDASAPSDIVPGGTSAAEADAMSLVKSRRFAWDKQLSVRLQALVYKAYKSREVHIDEINWLWIARRLHPTVGPRTCKNHWKYLHDSSRQVVWRHEDVRKLEEGIRLLGPKKMLQIRDHFLPHMTKDNIMRHWFRISDKATTIDEEEYYRLLNAVEDLVGHHTDLSSPGLSRQDNDASGDLQTQQWTEVEKRMGSGWKKMPCKRVWESSFQHLIRHAGWTSDEDNILLRMVKFVGLDDWYSVAKAMQLDKSPWQCRLRWCQLLDPVDLDTSDLFVNGEKYC